MEEGLSLLYERNWWNFYRRMSVKNKIEKRYEPARWGVLVPAIGLFSSDVIAWKMAKGEGEENLQHKLSKKHDAFKWPVAYCRGFSFVDGLSKPDSILRYALSFTCYPYVQAHFSPVSVDRWHGTVPRRFSAKKTRLELCAGSRACDFSVCPAGYTSHFRRFLFTHR